ncbi:hypothetical protein NMY22_g12369 [Coprinellus aureogranulatus]|nr:hypothetical protein NMY22_g12369 [Coprinellus aureogranulatus]
MDPIRMHSLGAMRRGTRDDISRAERIALGLYCFPNSGSAAANLVTTVHGSVLAQRIVSPDIQAYMPLSSPPPHLEPQV